MINHRREQLNKYSTMTKRRLIYQKSRNNSIYRDSYVCFNNKVTIYFVYNTQISDLYLCISRQSYIVVIWNWKTIKTDLKTFNCYIV